MSNKKKSNKKYGQGWKEPFMDLDLPSGNTCQVRRPGVQGLVKAGVLESLDVLTGLVSQTTIQKAEGKPEVDQKKILENPDSVTKMLDLLDDIVLYCVVQPKVLDKYYHYQGTDAEGLYYNVDRSGERVEDEETGKPVPIPEARRTQWEAPDNEEEEADENWPDIFLYVDDVDLEDKMFLMNFVVGGSRDLATFREAAQATLGGSQSGQATSQAAK